MVKALGACNGGFVTSIQSNNAGCVDTVTQWVSGRDLPMDCVGLLVAHSRLACRKWLVIVAGLLMGG